MLEKDLYEPMRLWLKNYLSDKYSEYDIITLDTSKERLDRVLERYNIKVDVAVGIDIQIDVLGIAKYKSDIKLFFIEAKKNTLKLQDIGQLWVYCKLIDPEEAFLLSPKGLGSINKVINILQRDDLLDFGDGKKIKKMRIGKWNVDKKSIDLLSIVPKL